MGFTPRIMGAAGVSREGANLAAWRQVNENGDKVKAGRLFDKDWSAPVVDNVNVELLENLLNDPSVRIAHIFDPYYTSVTLLFPVIYQEAVTHQEEGPDID